MKNITPKSAIGRRLKYFRLKKRLTITALSELSTITARTIHRIEDNKSDNYPSLIVLISLIESMDVTLEEFFNGM